ncbi:hypothetical protein Pmani_032140 [Petrolisthes manimaculis]|uniref:G-protein coupled receptors family 1 profile domain-containing protein n=1 Tax=Petrolisthes manimaculis TaxID=1843537 RepID=A0AAE1NUC4_9EUCA|nr:hypothetical protein Pmani_032140 [Petrolisthes manimaculis]
MELKLGQAATYRHTYYWFTAVTFILLPLCLLAFFNFFLIQAVRMSKVQRRKMTLVSERDHYSHQQETRSQSCSLLSSFWPSCVRCPRLFFCFIAQVLTPFPFLIRLLLLSSTVYEHPRAPRRMQSCVG